MEFTNFTGSVAGTVTYSYFSGQNAIETRTGSATSSPESLGVQYQYIFSPLGPKTPLLRDTYSGSSIVPNDRLYYLTDANTNVTAVVGYDTGTSTWVVAERYVYDPYGAVTMYDGPASAGGDWSRPHTISSVGNTLLYARMVLDPTTGLYYDEARWYSTAVSTFISRDPAQSTTNLYAYCGDEATDETDPSGLIGIFFDGAGRTFGEKTVMQRLAARYVGMTGGREPIYVYTTPMIPYLTPDWSAAYYLLNNAWSNVFQAYTRVAESVSPKKAGVCSQIGPVNIFGWSWGAAEALNLASLLKDGVKTRNGGVIKPVVVYYLGLIDPVMTGIMMAVPPVPDNVMYVATAWAGKKSTIGHIAFNASSVILQDPTKTTRFDATFPLTHEQIGWPASVENWLAARTPVTLFK